MTTGPSLPVALCGTEEAPAPIRQLAIGAIAFDLEAGKIRYVTIGGVEAVRCIAFVVRGPGWETLSPDIADLRIGSDEDRLQIDYKALYAGSGGRLQVTASISASAEGSLRFAAEAEALTDFNTARTSFCILHPIARLAGRPLRVTHTDERIETTRFPDGISAHQPFFDIRALAHEVADGLWATVRMEGDVWEMEDQRNWTDASYKTYGRPRDLPWPYTLSRGTRVIQTATLSLDGAPPRWVAAAALPVEIEVGGRAIGRLPSIALALSPAEAAASVAAAGRHGVRPRRLVCWFEHGVHGMAELQAYAAVGQRLQAPLAFELILPCKAPVEREMSEFGELLAAAGIVPEALMPIQAALTKWVLKAPEEMGLPGFAELYAAARRAFPGVPVGAGVVSNFTELNIDRPPVAGADYVTHCTAAVIHEPDDRSVMETLETLPHIFRSVRALAGDLPYRLGPSAIGMRYNPYGKDTEANLANIRIAFARQDPRHRGLFGAAFALGYLARAARSGIDAVCFGALTGPFGLVHRRMEDDRPWFDAQPAGSVYPLYHVVLPIAEADGAAVLPADSSDEKRVLALAYRRGDSGSDLWLANLTAEPQPVRLTGAALGTATIKTLDASTFARATLDPDGFAAAAGEPQAGPVELAPYAVARLRARAPG